MARCEHRHGKHVEIETVSDEELAAYRRRWCGGTTKAPAPKRKQFRCNFVRLPIIWVDVLSGKKGPVWQLAVALQAEKHKRSVLGGEIIISAATVPGMSRMVRWRATAKLVALGLVEIDRPSDQAAPRVTNFRE